MKKNMVYFLLLFMMSCSKEKIISVTSRDVNIVGYLENHIDSFSLLLSVIQKAEAEGFLTAYGNYTFFAPTNSAVQQWLADKKYASTDVLTQKQANDFVKVHLINDTLSTIDFTDGKLPTITYYRQYLITDVALLNGTARYRINKSAFITQSDIRTGNGYIQVLNKVIEPATKTVSEIISENGRYTIFTQALKATGYYDSLNHLHSEDTTREWLTVVAQSDSFYQSIGIFTYQDLFNKYSNTGNPSVSSDSLNLYVGYHIFSGLRFLADIATSTSILTHAPLEVVTVTLRGDSILLNETTFNNVLEPGLPFNRNQSDIVAENGAVHEITGDLHIIVRSPTSVYFDVADQTELRKMVSIFRKQGQTLSFTDSSQFSGISWNGGSITYNCVASASTDYLVYNDYLSIELRSGVVQWLEFTTPFIVKGKYKVWVCYRRGGKDQTTQATFDGVALPKLFNYGEYYPTSLAQDVAEAQGYKRYMTYPNTYTTNTSRLLGTVEVTTSDVHKIRFVAISNTGGGSANRFNIDMVQFIPSDQDQQWPRFNKDGSLIYK